MVRLAAMVTPNCAVANMLNTNMAISIRFDVRITTHLRVGTLSIIATNPSSVIRPKNV